jgi:hypothetical protein
MNSKIVEMNPTENKILLESDLPKAMLCSVDVIQFSIQYKVARKMTIFLSHNLRRTYISLCVKTDVLRSKLLLLSAIENLQ